MFRTVSENFTLKIIALASSVLIWLYVGGEQNPTLTRVVNAEVRSRGQAQENLLVRLSGDPIPVEVSGPRSEVESIADNQIKAVVDLSRARSGDRQVYIVELQRPAKAPMVSLRQLRQYVDAEVKPKASKQFPITASFNDAPPSGRVYGRPKLSPAYAKVIGAKEDVQRVQKLAVYIETTGGNVRAEETIQALDADGVTVDTVTIEPTMTKVELDLMPAPSSRSLPVAVQLQGRPTPPYTVAEISVNPPIIEVSGRPEQIVQMRNVPTGSVSLDGLTAESTVEVPLILPDGVSVRGNTTTVRVTIRVRDASRAIP